VGQPPKLSPGAVWLLNLSDGLVALNDLLGAQVDLHDQTAIDALLPWSPEARQAAGVGSSTP